MRFRRRVKLSEQQRADMWGRWRAGQSLHEIGRAFGKDHVSIQFMLAQRGGIAPAVRHRSLRTLTLAEREDISRGIASGSSIRDIAKALKRAVSTVSREVARYRAAINTHTRPRGARLPPPPPPPPPPPHLSIEPMKRISRPGSRPCAPRSACLPSTGSCRGSLRVN
jgi:DNA-binding CsgD family transcriptional regulator